MNKYMVDQLLPLAVKIITDSGISENGTDVERKFRSQISSFGAAVSMGSLLSAVAFFSDKGSSDVERPKLMKAINMMIQKDSALLQLESKENLFDTIRENGCSNPAVKEAVLNCAIAIKLAMNLYHLTPEKSNNKEKARDEP